VSSVRRHFRPRKLSFPLRELILGQRIVSFFSGEEMSGGGDPRDTKIG